MIINKGWYNTGRLETSILQKQCHPDQKSGIVQRNDINSLFTFCTGQFNYMITIREATWYYHVN
jgi:hypothetical protein